MNRYLSEPSYSDPNLGVEARQIVSEAGASMDKWIEDSVKSLEDRANRELEAATKQLTDEAKIVEDGYREATEALEKLLSDLSAMSARAPDMTEMTAEIQKSKTAVEGVRKYLKEREERWKNAGKGIVNTSISLAKKSVGIPG